MHKLGEQLKKKEWLEGYEYEHENGMDGMKSLFEQMDFEAEEKN